MQSGYLGKKHLFVRDTVANLARLFYSEARKLYFEAARKLYFEAAWKLYFEAVRKHYLKIRLSRASGTVSTPTMVSNAVYQGRIASI
jgi:hypothetical protein